MITLRLWMIPASAPSYEVEPTTTARNIQLVATNILPIGFVVFMVVGVIILGWATPTEAAAFGVLSYQALRESLNGTVRVAAMVFFILMNSTGLIEWATSFDVSALMVLFMMFVVLIVLGIFMDAVSMMLIPVPLFFPLAGRLGFDLVWFGLFVLITIEMAGTTTPFGQLLYVMLGVAPPGTSLFQVANAAFPALASYLPSLM